MDALVSILVPVYAPGPVIERCFESIRKQTYPAVEVIPIDDAGPEPMRDILAHCATTDPRWRPLYHERNQGLAASLNDAFRASSGAYILVLEQDCELAQPDAIERALEVAQTHPRWCLSGLRRLPFSEMRALEVAFGSIRNHLADASSADLRPKAFMELKCDLIPREALVAVSGFDERYRVSGEDQVLSLRLRRLGWEIITTKSLEILVRSGRQTTFVSNIRKSYLYGASQAAVLRGRTRELIAVDVRIGQGRERLVNRFLSVTSALCLYALVPIVLLAFLRLAPVYLILPLAIIPFMRAAIVISRTLRLRHMLTHRWRAALLTLLLCPVDDLVYTAALAHGMLTRRPRVANGSVKA